MPFITLPPNTFQALQYRIKESEDEGAFVDLTVESDVPVKTYIVRPKGLEYFKQGSTTFKYYGGFPDPRMHQSQEIWLPFTGPFYVIISNPSQTKEAEIEYDVSF